MAKRFLTEAQEQEICRRYLAGESTYQLGDFFGCSAVLIQSTLKRQGVKARTTKQAKGGLTDEQEQTVVARYQAGENSEEIAASIGKTGALVLGILKKHGVERRTRRRFTDEQEQEIARRYLAGETMGELGKAYGTSATVIHDALKRQKVQTRASGETRKGRGNTKLKRFDLEQEKRICARYEGGETSTSLAQEFGVDPTTVMNILRRHGKRSRDRNLFTAEQKAEICRLYQEGESNIRLAKQFGCSASTITTILKQGKAQLRPHGSSQKRFTKQQEEEIKQLYLNGESTIQLAKALGTSPGTISRILEVAGVERKYQGRNDLTRKFSDQEEQEICDRYEAGESRTDLAARFGSSPSTITNVLDRRGVERRSISEAHGGLPPEQEAQVCSRYEEGESTIELSEVFGVSIATVRAILQRGGVERRTPGGYGDSVQLILDSEGHHERPRECWFYLFELASYSETHSKPGIAFDIELRADEEYGEEVMRVLFSTRAEAYFLEQAVLYATEDKADCPDELREWLGASEIRAMPAAELEPVALHMLQELEEMGVWAFAAEYVPMAASQRLECRLRAGA